MIRLAEDLKEACDVVEDVWISGLPTEGQSNGQELAQLFVRLRQGIPLEAALFICYFLDHASLSHKLRLDYRVLPFNAFNPRTNESVMSVAPFSTFVWNGGTVIMDGLVCFNNRDLNTVLQSLTKLA